MGLYSSPAIYSVAGPLSLHVGVPLASLYPPSVHLMQELASPQAAQSLLSMKMTGSQEMLYYNDHLQDTFDIF